MPGLDYDNDLTSVEEVSGRTVDASPTKSGAAVVSADTDNIRSWQERVNSLQVIA